MLVTLCWRKFLGVGDIFWILVSDANVIKQIYETDFGQFRHRDHKVVTNAFPTSVTNINENPCHDCERPRVINLHIRPHLC